VTKAIALWPWPVASFASITHPGDQPVSADVFDLLLHLRAGVERRLQMLPDITDLPVADRFDHTLAVAIGIQTGCDIIV